MRDRGFDRLADDYTDYYLSAWDYFLSGFKDTDAGRSAVDLGRPRPGPGRGYRARVARRQP